jgi:hypothetical protein
LLRSLRGSEWSQLADYVSPSFFEVLPARTLWRQARELVGNLTDAEGFHEARRVAAARMAGLDEALDVELDVREAYRFCASTAEGP